MKLPFSTASRPPPQSTGYSGVIVGLLWLFVLSVIAGVGYFSYQDRQNQISLSLMRAESNALIFEDQITQSMQLIENSLRILPTLSDTPLNSVSPATLSQSLRQLQFSQPALRSLSVMTEAEGIRASTNPANLGKRVDLSAFLPLDNPSSSRSTLRLGLPWQGRDLSDSRAQALQADGPREPTYFLTLALRLGQDADAVWVLAALNPDYLLGRLERYNQQGADQYTLARLDGTILLSSSDGQAGKLVQPEGLLQRIQQEELGFDNQTNLLAFRTSARHPFFVTVEIKRSTLLDDWLQRTQWLVAATVLGLTGVLFFSRMLLGRIRLGQRAEREQQQVIHRLSQAIEQSPSAILITDRQGIIEYANPFFSTLCGYSPQELLDQDRYRMNAPGMPANFFQSIRDQLNRGVNWAGEFNCRHRDGRDYTVFAMLAPLRDESGKITHHICVEHDITEQKKLSAELERARDRAEAATRAKSQFLANMSHEIRTPMNGIIGMTELALQLADNTAQRSHLSNVRSSAQALMGILNDILDFSKIEAGQLDIENVSFDLRRMTRQVVDGLLARAAGKGLEMSCTVADNCPEQLVGDPVRLRQVLNNLCDNAIKFTQRGSIAVNLRLLGTDSDGYEMQFSVRDTGIGISPKQQRLIFTAFNQADSSATRKFGGTGLGLSISARLVDLMHGRIWVESVEGHGSTFHFTVRLGVSYQPASNASSDFMSLAQAAQPAATRRGLHILLAEDHPVNQQLAMAMLEKWGHTVRLAPNGEKAVTLYASEDWDLVLMDVQMPVMDGLEATRRIRLLESERNRRTPIIAVTANAMEGDRDSVLAAGMDDYLTKPFTATKLQAMLARHCPGVEPA